jgi:hypothetical protein
MEKFIKILALLILVACTPQGEPKRKVSPTGVKYPISGGPPPPTSGGPPPIIWGAPPTGGTTPPPTGETTPPPTGETTPPPVDESTGLPIDEVIGVLAPTQRSSADISFTPLSAPPDKSSDDKVPEKDKDAITLAEITSASFQTSEEFYDLCDSPVTENKSDPRYLPWIEKCKNVPLDDYAILYKDITVWPVPRHWENKVVPTGPRALAANFPQEHNASTAAFARLGLGRIFVLGNDNYFWLDTVISFSPINGISFKTGKTIAAAMTELDSGRYGPRANEFYDAPKLIQNIMKWVSLPSTPNDYGTFLGSGGGEYEFLQNLSSYWHDFHPDYHLRRIYVDNFSTDPSLLDHSRFPFILVNVSNIQNPDAEYPLIKRYIEEGGGVILMGSFWKAWDSDPPIESMEKANKFLEDFQIKFGVYNSGITKNYPLYTQDIVNSYSFLPALFLKYADEANSLTPPFSEQKITSLVKALNNFPTNNSYYFSPSITKMYEDILNPIYNFTLDPMMPVSGNLPNANKIDFSVDLTLKSQLDLYQGLAMLQPNLPFLLPEDGTFPGSIGSDVEVEKKISFDVYNPDLNGRRDPHQIPQKWYFTGLYAPPGKSIEISIDSANSEDLQSLQVLIGPHIDNIIDGATMRPNGSHPGIITRFPKVFANFTGLKLGKNNFRNPYGGLLILRGFKNKPSLQNIDLTIKGCIEAPYIKNDTTKEKLDHFKSLNVPWGVIEASRAVLVVPKSTIAEIPNPSSPGQSPPHIKALDFVYEKLYDLLGFKSDDPNPIQRPWYSKHWHVIDLQISAGYAHSGFPAMYHSDWANMWKSPSEIQGNDWGLYHEQGHNWQYSANKTSVDGEVTNNLFSEYLYTVAGHPRSQGTLDLKFLDDLRSNNISYYSGDVWHSLLFWVQMIFYIERFPLPNKIGGWDIVRTHYRYTRAVNDTQRNLESGFSNTQKDNQLCLLFSQWTGYNLVSYFNKYKRTINAETQSKINALNLKQPSPEIWAFNPFAP